jgi:antitoxin component YwqK of YwqJK toxin-antitoxin module
MKFLLTLLLGLAANAGADTFILKDGARLEGEVTGEMDNMVMVKTKYGALNINKADISEQKPDAAPKAPEAPVSTAATVAVSTAQPAPAEPAPAKFTFATVTPSTSTRLLVYSENGVAIATETFDAAGAAVSLEGAIKDGTYTEVYPDGKLKTVKTVLGGKASGTLKAYYPSGTVQVEAYYLGGLKDGAFKYSGEDGKLLMEASYRGDKLNGWKREFGPDGLPKSETYYADDKPAEPPKVQAAAAPAKEPESMVTAKTLNLARGERFSFQLNGKYVGKLTLDKNYNIISQEGKVPDGAVKVYSAEGKLQKELVFEKSALKALRVYEDGGPLKAEYGFKEDAAVKK